MIAAPPSTVERLLQISLKDIKRLGLLVKGTRRAGCLMWNRGGREVARIAVSVDAAGVVPCVRFLFQINGAPSDHTVLLRAKRSNLNGAEYYCFICPVTGRSCFKLYFVGGRFVSRFAFRALYEKQTYGRAERGGTWAYLRKCAEAERLDAARYRKRTYRGKLTPWGRKCAKVEARGVELAAAALEELKQAEKGPKLADFGAWVS